MSTNVKVSPFGAYLAYERRNYEGKSQQVEGKRVLADYIVKGVF
jgi:hypothetical protein